jgi:hypothetical protein
MKIGTAFLIVAFAASCAAPASPSATSTLTPSQSSPASAAASQAALPLHNGALDPGTYETRIFQPRMTLTFADKQWMLMAGEDPDRVSDFVHNGPGTGEQITFAVFRLGESFNVLNDPCNPDAGVKVPPIGSGREELVSWLGRFPLLGASQPTPIAIRGRQGIEVKLVIDDAAVAKCPDQAAALWRNASGGTLGMPAGSDDRLTILDVGGRAIVIPWSLTPESASATLEPEMRKVLDTLTFADQ